MPFFFYITKHTLSKYDRNENDIASFIVVHISIPNTSDNIRMIRMCNRSLSLNPIELIDQIKYHIYHILLVTYTKVPILYAWLLLTLILI